MIGLGEMGGGGESAEAVFRAMKSYLVGHDPARLEEMRFLIANPPHRFTTIARRFSPRWSLLVSISSDRLGRAGFRNSRRPFTRHDSLRFLLSFVIPNPHNGDGEVRTIEQLVEHARDFEASVTASPSHKLKGGVFPPEYELEVLSCVGRCVARRFVSFRSNGVWSTETGHLVRSGNRRHSQRLSRRSGLRHERHAAHA